MKFSDITKAVHDAWTFAWPPLAMCAILFFIARYLNPDGTRQAIDALVVRLRAYGTQIDNARSLLEPYGLTKLIPVISAVAVIGVLYVLNGPATVLASKFPPHVSYRPDVLMARSMSSEEKLVLLRKYPTASSFNNAFYLALGERAVDRDAPPRQRASLNYKVENFIKFALLAAMVLVLVNTRSGLPVGRQILRLLWLVAILTPLWFANLVGLLRNQENQFHDEWNGARVKLLSGTPTTLGPEISDREKAILGGLSTPSPIRWWRVYIIDPYVFTWLRVTFFPPKQGDG